MANPNQPQKELTDRITFLIKDIGSDVHEASCKDGTRRLMNALSHRLGQIPHPITEQDIIDLRNELTREESHPLETPGAWYAEIKKLRANYTLAYNAMRSIRLNENSVHRNERRAQIRALWFRIATTLGIGFSVMIVYGVASYLGLSMPLSRMNVS